jgi:hypothetical protein
VLRERLQYEAEQIRKQKAALQSQYRAALTEQQLSKVRVCPSCTIAHVKQMTIDSAKSNALARLEGCVFTDSSLSS